MTSKARMRNIIKCECSSRVMTRHVRMSNIIKCGVTKFHSNVFTWKIEDGSCKTITDIFQFCGYCCYFVYECKQLGYGGKDDVTVTLHGYQAPYRKQISCHYSFMIIIKDCRTPTTKIGEIHTTEEKFCIDIFNGSLCKYFNYDTICFSWSENGDSVVLSQGVQTEPERLPNVLERGTQTEEKQNSTVSENHTETGTESYKFLEILSKELGSFFEGQTDYDCVLKVGETKFHVHRSVLAARSPVFAAMFHHDTSESRNGVVDIPDVDVAAFGEVLYYIYAGKIRGLSSDTAVSMYVVADKYSLIDLRDKCVGFLMWNLTMENVCDAALLAHTHAETKLEKKVTDFIEERLDDLGENERWKIFSDTHAKLANKFLFSAFVSSKKK